MPARAASSTTSWIDGDVDDGQHLLGLRLRRREEPGAEPGSGDDRLLTFTGGHDTRTASDTVPGAAPIVTSAWACRLQGRRP